MKEKSTGIGLTGFMFLIFLVLKLMGVISWSWWWVTAPLWIPAIIVLLVISSCIFIARRGYNEKGGIK